jgi:hypothetical protein
MCSTKFDPVGSGELARMEIGSKLVKLTEIRRFADADIEEP